MLFLGETSVKSTIFLRDYTYDRSIGTTQSLTIKGPSRTLLYIPLVSVVIFIINGGIYVGIYFYKHCNTQSYSTKIRKDYQISNQREEYNSVELNVDEKGDHSRDQTYLEHASDAKPNYEETIF